MTYGKDGLYDAAYTYGLERIEVEDLDETRPESQDPLYYLYDGLGSVAYMVKPDGNMRDYYRYDEYGKPAPGNSKQSPDGDINLNNTFGYTGEMWDEESGLLYLRARYYEPETGRFLSRDTYEGDLENPLSRHLYTYVGNNPVNAVDPTGHVSQKVKHQLSKLHYKKDGYGNPYTYLREMVSATGGSIWYDTSKRAALVTYYRNNQPETYTIYQDQWNTEKQMIVMSRSAFERILDSPGTKRGAISTPIVAGSVATGALGKYDPDLLLSGMVAGLGAYTYYKASQWANDLTDSIIGSQTKTNDRQTLIYRWGSYNNYNLTPRATDVEGLSFSLNKPASGKYVVSSMELVNSTGVLMAIKDRPGHVSVLPVDVSRMSEWIASKPNSETNPHEFTTLLKSISFPWR